MLELNSETTFKRSRNKNGKHCLNCLKCLNHAGVGINGVVRTNTLEKARNYAGASLRLSRTHKGTPRLREGNASPADVREQVLGDEPLRKTLNNKILRSRSHVCGARTPSPGSVIQSRNWRFSRRTARLKPNSKKRR